VAPGQAGRPWLRGRPAWLCCGGAQLVTDALTAVPAGQLVIAEVARQRGQPPGPRLAALADRILLGSGVPNIPDPYLHQLEALARLELGAGWLRAVCYHNAVRLLGL